jgi:hypothetical protein
MIALARFSKRAIVMQSDANPLRSQPLHDLGATISARGEQQLGRVVCTECLLCSGEIAEDT